MKRRRLLAGAGAALATTAGCLAGMESEDPSGGDAETASDGDGDGDDGCPDGYGETPEPPEPDGATPVEYETIYVTRDQSRDRTYPDGVTRGPIDLFDDAETATEILDFDAVDADRRGAVRAFVQETDFEAAQLLYVSAEGGHLAYEDLEIAALGRDGDALVGSAVMPDPCAAGDHVESLVSVLVRVAVPDRRPERARITIVDGEDCVGTFEATPGVSDVRVVDWWTCPE